MLRWFVPILLLCSVHLSSSSYVPLVRYLPSKNVPLICHPMFRWCIPILLLRSLELHSFSNVQLVRTSVLLQYTVGMSLSSHAPTYVDLSSAPSSSSESSSRCYVYLPSSYLPSPDLNIVHFSRITTYSPDNYIVKIDIDTLRSYIRKMTSALWMGKLITILLTTN